MSNVVVAMVVGGAVVLLTLLGSKGLGKLMMLVGLMAIGIIVLLLWAGRLRPADVTKSVEELVGTQPSTTRDPDAPATATGVTLQSAASKRDPARALNALRVRGRVPSACQEAAGTVVNRAAPTDVRLAALRRLVENGVVLEMDKQPIDGGRLLTLLQ